jgi:hypothetical protein
MKKIAFLIFVAAIVLGIGLAYATGSVSKAGSWMSFNFSVGSGIKGSGNIKSETRDLPKFTTVDFGGAIEMEITAQKDQRVEIETDDNILPLITTEVKGDTLYISNEQKINWHNPVKVRISVRELDGLNVSGASKTDASNIKSDTFKLDVSGASKIKLAGEANSLSAEASGASRIDATDLKALKASANASGASKILVNATDSVDADASGASGITYSGNPKNVKKNASGASSVNAN